MPDIAILDISMPGLTGLEILTIANSERISTRLVFFTAFVQDRELVMAAAGGAYGIIQKEVALEILVQSLRQVAAGQRLLPLRSPGQAVSWEQKRANIAISENVLTVLTERERQIVALVSEGLSNKEIGRRLNIADGTIKVHLHHIFQKLEISNRTVLAAFAISHNDDASLLPGNPREFAIEPGINATTSFVLFSGFWSKGHSQGARSRELTRWKSPLVQTSQAVHRRIYDGPSEFVSSANDLWPVR